MVCYKLERTLNFVVYNDFDVESILFCFVFVLLAFTTRRKLRRGRRQGIVETTFGNHLDLDLRLTRKPSKVSLFHTTEKVTFVLSHVNLQFIVLTAHYLLLLSFFTQDNCVDARFFLKFVKTRIPFWMPQFDLFYSLTKTSFTNKPLVINLCLLMIFWNIIFILKVFTMNILIRLYKPVALIFSIKWSRCFCC